MTTFASKSRKVTLACVAAFAASTVTATAFATPVTSSADGAPAVEVRFDDLNLSTERGTTALYHRITNAARQVCPSQYVRGLSMVAASQKCQAEAIARAVHDVNSPQLAMVFANHTRHG